MYDKEFKEKLIKTWKNLSFKVHKPQFEFDLQYTYKEDKFNQLNGNFINMIEILLLALVLNYPIIYNQIKYQLGSKRDVIELFLLENK